MLTPLHAQCDSAISLCPDVFDRLIKNDIRVVQLEDDSILHFVQTKALYASLFEKGNALMDCQRIAVICDKQRQLVDKELEQSKKEVKKLQRKTAIQKIEIWVISIVGVISTGYFIIN